MPLGIDPTVDYAFKKLFGDPANSDQHLLSERAAVSEVAAPHLRFVLSDCEHGVLLSDSLQIHTIELPKYNYQGLSLSAAAPLTQWAFFLDRAAGLEAAELKRLLPAPEHAKATEIMETIARTPEERRYYESRRKAELDYRAGIDEALALGLEKGERLALLEQVRFLQGLLQEPESAESELQAMDLEVLRRLCGGLKDRLRQAR